MLHEGGRYHLTHMEGKILGFFIRHPGATLRNLVAHLRQDKGQFARLIRSLKDQELLEAQTDAGDRRSVPLDPPARVATSIKSYSGKSESFRKLPSTDLSASERHQLVVLLNRVRSNLEGVITTDKYRCRIARR